MLPSIAWFKFACMHPDSVRMLLMLASYLLNGHLHGAADHGHTHCAHPRGSQPCGLAFSWQHTHASMYEMLVSSWLCDSSTYTVHNLGCTGIPT
jgi:hypothetical protein